MWIREALDRLTGIGGRFRTAKSRWPTLRLRFEPLEARTLLSAGGAEPNDPQFADNPAWHPDRYHLDRIDAPGAWAWFQDRDPTEWGGEGVLVAVVDSGVR